MLKCHMNCISFIKDSALKSIIINIDVNNIY